MLDRFKSHDPVRYPEAIADLIEAAEKKESTKAQTDSTNTANRKGKKSKSTNKEDDEAKEQPTDEVVKLRDEEVSTRVVNGTLSYKGEVRRVVV